jgi:hypothetical protein
VTPQLTEYELTVEERASLTLMREEADKLKLQIYQQNLELEAFQEQVKHAAMQKQNALQQTITQLHDAELRSDGAVNMLTSVHLPGARLSPDGKKLLKG